MVILSLNLKQWSIQVLNSFHQPKLYKSFPKKANALNWEMQNIFGNAPEAYTK